MKKKQTKRGIFLQRGELTNGRPATTISKYMPVPKEKEKQNKKEKGFIFSALKYIPNFFWIEKRGVEGWDVVVEVVVVLVVVVDRTTANSPVGS